MEIREGIEYAPSKIQLEYSLTMRDEEVMNPVLCIKIGMALVSQKSPHILILYSILAIGAEVMKFMESEGLVQKFATKKIDVKAIKLTADVKELVIETSAITVMKMAYVLNSI